MRLRLARILVGLVIASIVLYFPLSLFGLKEGNLKGDNNPVQYISDVNTNEFQSLFKINNITGDGCTMGGSWGDFNDNIKPVLLINNGCNNSMLYSFDQKYIHQRRVLGSSGGSCWGDVNQDGWEDVLILGDGPDRLYVNIRGNFTHVSHLNRTDSSYGVGKYCKMVDVTHDGHLDILRVNTLGKLTIFQRILTSDHEFQDITNQTTLPHAIKSIATIAKFPGRHMFSLISDQGKLHYFDYRNLPFRNVTDNFYGLRNYTVKSAVLTDMNNDKNYDIILLPESGPPSIGYNIGKNRFTPTILPGPSREEALDIVVADFNNDMLEDLFVVRRAESKVLCLFYVNKGSSFSLHTSHIISEKNYTTSIGVADYNLDGYLDMALFSGNTYLLTNTQTNVNNSWIEIDIFSAFPHLPSGTVVGVVADGVTQHKTIQSENYLTKRLHFGLGKASVVSEIYILWTFAKQHFYGLLPNQLITFVSPRVLTDRHYSINILSKRGAPKIMCPSGTKRLIPAFLMLGIWKAGTTSLAATLSQHPQVEQSSSKELCYFNIHHQQLPIDWYWGQFPCSNESSHMSFEATAAYLFSASSPPLVYKYLPNAKFIITLREPIDRLYSHYYMINADNFEGPEKFDQVVRGEVEQFRECIRKLRAGRNQTLKTDDHDWDGCDTNPSKCDAAVCINPSALVSVGLYYFQMMRWLALFPIEQFIVVHYSDFVGSNTDKVITDIERFLGLDEMKLPPLKTNISPKRTKMLDSTRQYLQLFHQPYNKLLYDLLKIDYGWDKG